MYPSACPVCGKATGCSPASPICGQCWDGVLPLGRHSCGICAKPLGSVHAGTCGECLKHRPPYRKAFSFGEYAGTMKEAIHLLKFGAVKRLARPLGALLAVLDLPPADFIVPVPLSLGGLRQRGFNQTLLIAREAARRKGIPLETGLLYKKKDTPPQVSLSRSARLVNLRGAFGARRTLEGGRVLLVDDVITTGATVGECSKTLLKAGAEEVYAASLARA